MLKNPPPSKSIWPFSPQSIPGLALWLDAADESTLTMSGSSVTQWKDKSDNGFVATPFDGAITKTTLNGNTALDFSDKRMTIPNFTWNMSFTSIIVWKGYWGSQMIGLTASTATNAGWYDYISTGNWALIMLNYNGANSTDPNYIRGPEDSYPGAPNIVVNSNQWFIFSIGYTAGTTTITNYAVNGSARRANSVSEQTGSNTGVYFINGLSNGAYDYSQVAEIIHYNTSLTTSQRQQVEGYLAWKWNLGSLPATHPYYGIPVFSRTFQPLDIPGCSLWLDAADESAITLSGSSVTQWKDKSGNGFAAAPIDSTITKTTLNGNTVLEFGANRMTIPNFTWNNSFTTIIVCKPQNASMIYGLCQGGQYSSIINFIFTANWILMMMNDNGYGTVDADYLSSGGWPPIPVVPANQWCIFSIGYNNGTNPTNYTINGLPHNNTWSSTSLTPATHTGTLYINGLSNYPYDNSQVAEIIHYNTSISSSQRQQVEAYLASKWKLQAILPSSHPGYRLPAYSVTYPITISFSPSSLLNMGVWLDPSDSDTVTLSGSNVTGITSKLVDEYQTSEWYSPNGGVIVRTINNRTALGFPGGSLRNDYVYFPNGYNMSIFTIAQIPSDRPFINIFSKGITIQLKPDGIDVWIVSDNYSNGIFFLNTNGNQMPTDTNQIYFISIVITTQEEDASQASCYCTINGVQTPMGLWDYYSPVPYDTETYLMTDFGDTTFDGTAGESIIYTDNKSTAECQKLEGYLAWKWGVQSFLPSSHPYAFTPP